MSSLLAPRAPVDRRVPAASTLLIPAKSTLAANPYEAYRFRILDYVKDKLKVTPWRGVTGCTCSGRAPHSHPGQAEVLEAFDRVMLQQHERELFLKGQLATDQLVAYVPGQVIRAEIQVPGGHSTGKTNVVGMASNYFFDVFAPCVISIVAPKAEQAKEQVLQEIKDLRRGKHLPGKVMDRIIQGIYMVDPNDPEGAKHFIRIATASMSGGKAGERLQGMHAPFQLILLDESEGIHASFIEPLRSWLSGGQGAMFQLANPRTRTSWFNTERDAISVQRLTLNSLFHPNVLENSNRFPGAVQRDYVERLLAKCKRVAKHDPSMDTFECPWRPGEIYQADEEFSFRVLGEAPVTFSPRCFITPGAFLTARRKGDALIGSYA